LLVLCLFAGGAFFRPGSAQGQGSADKVSAAECCAVLLYTVGARSLGLGDAVTAATSPGAIFANPAAIGGIVTDQFVVHSASTPLDTRTTISLLLNSEVAGTFGVTYRLIDLGEIPSTDENGVVTGNTSNYFQLLVATYATRIAGSFFAGVNYKLFQFRIDCQGYCGGEEVSATTHVVDLGVHFESARIPWLRVGASVVNFGFPLQVVNDAQADPTPLRLRAGVGYEIAHHLREDRQVQVWLYGDVVASPRDPGASKLNVGAEMSVEETIHVWAGYAAGSSGLTAGAGVGVGLTYDRFDAGISKSFATTPDQSEPTQLSFGIRF
jgi:hypothetical protein